MAKTPAQIEKRKRETEKRKKTEKAILKKAAEMSDEDTRPVTGSQGMETRTPKQGPGEV